MGLPANKLFQGPKGLSTHCLDWLPFTNHQPKNYLKKRGVQAGGCLELRSLFVCLVPPPKSGFHFWLRPYPMFPRLIHPRDAILNQENVQVANGGGYGQRSGGDPCLVLTSDPKPRLRWTADLHERFVDAVTQLGGASSQHRSSFYPFFLALCSRPHPPLLEAWFLSFLNLLFDWLSG